MLDNIHSIYVTNVLAIDIQSFSKKLVISILTLEKQFLKNRLSFTHKFVNDDVLYWFETKYSSGQYFVLHHLFLIAAWSQKVIQRINVTIVNKDFLCEHFFKSLTHLFAIWLLLFFLLHLCFWQFPINFHLGSVLDRFPDSLG